ncbi:uncharacterized protein MONOS_16000 [Monocercomonoides exilis]|uniref:uncharacterized protein n=1 Tax=Monocercomonoides exilis TaxID=2049356 RepID=UPI00355A293E|nr:hypothetical protein MONOS_16000 [Monocercomonoides exilis]|eukprot:MONOS_16000.1-p1 / transcript=MONOS_16000.1 / gene=MONOS_16000 / organism=Monocercomonoides_exilis_PA203 / gene_product=unspecified product / transcript_product=unspecified product / location=Mono_scaffold01453:451-3117(+) / protein_length=888 / sequence_SO=supercontig / SO=protein_coding / is_pseudo=false
MPEFSETGLPPSASVSSSWRPSASASASSTSTSTVLSESSSSPSLPSSSSSSSTKVENLWFSPPKKSLWKKISEMEEKNFEGVEERKEMEIVDKDKKKERKGRGGMNEKNKKKGKKGKKGRISGLLKRKKEVKLREVVLVDESEIEDEEKDDSDNQRFSIQTLSSDSSDSYTSSDSSVELAFNIPTFTQLNGNSMESQSRENDFLGLDNHPPLLRSISSMSSSTSPSSSQTVTADMSDWEIQQSMKEKQSECSPRRCRALNLMRTMTDEELNELDVAGPIYSESTLKKHEYVEDIYITFCNMRRIPAYPLDTRNAASFLRFLYRSRCYVRASIENVFACSLKRIESMRTGVPVSAEVSQSIANVLQEGRIDKSVKDSGNGKEPCLLCDVARIISKTNDLSPSKAMEASLWLVAIFTGARAVTMWNVLVGDIGALIPSESGDTLILKINLRVTKGNPHWNHTISLEGTLDERNDLNVLYWLNQHLIQTFSLDLREIESWVLNEDLKFRRLWDLNRDAMSQRLRRRAQDAGYPHDLFSFHSFRSGFMCSAILASGVDAHSRDSTYIFTAAIAGWIPNSKVQNRYSKPAITGTIVTNRIITSKISNEVVDTSLINPEAFHNIRFNNDIEHNVSERTAVLWVRRAFKERINVERVTSTTAKKTEEKRKLYKQRAWKDAVSRYVLSDDDMEREAKEIYTQHPNYKNIHSRSSTMTNVRVDVGIRHLNERYYDEGEKLDDIVEDLLRFVEDEVDGTKEMKQHNRKKPCPYEHALHREVDDHGHRKRIPWTEEEDQKLREMHSEKKRLVEMAAELPNRMPRDCRDRLRNLGVIDNWKNEGMTKKKMRRRKTIMKDDDDTDDDETEEIDENDGLEEKMKKRNTKERKIEINFDDEK